MCYNPMRILSYEYTVDGIPKNLLLFSTTPFEYSVGLVIVDKDNSYRMTSKMKKQFIRDGLSLPLHFIKRLEIPCGKCLDCAKARAREWSVRCELEAMQWKHNYFVTLTYNNENIKRNHWIEFNPDDETAAPVHKWRSTVCMKDVSDFIKLLRQEFQRKFGEDNIRFFACTEYGSRTHRPHAHLILFNCNLRDLRYHAPSKTGQKMYRSAVLEKLWKKGFITVQPYTKECARYVAQYCTKKLNKRDSVLEHCEEERLNMSRRPGIGTLWFRQNFEKMFTPHYLDGKLTFADYIPLSDIDKDTGRPVLRHYNVPKAFTRQFKRVTDNVKGVYNDYGVLGSACVCDNGCYSCMDNIYYHKYRDYKDEISRYRRSVALADLGYSLLDSFIDLNFDKIDGQKRYLAESKFKVKRDYSVLPASDGIISFVYSIPKPNFVIGSQMCLYE